VQLVGETGGEELGEQRPAALDHEPAYPAFVEVLAQAHHPHRPPGVDHRGRAAEAATYVCDARGGAIDELVAVAGGEEVGARIEVAAAGDPDLGR
jgi:hypothetical protein